MSPINSNIDRKKKQFWRTEFLFKLYLTETNKTHEFSLADQIVDNVRKTIGPVASFKKEKLVFVNKLPKTRYVKLNE
jgi:acyl-coenzyme A synthetase/AMP-(fatty) acid ligase